MLPRVRDVKMCVNLELSGAGTDATGIYSD